MTFEKKVKNFVKENFGVTAEVGDRFEAYPYEEKKVIFFPTNVSNMRCKEFMDNYCSEYEAKPTADEFIIALLHEVGHIETTKNQLPCITEIHKQRALSFQFGLVKNELEYFYIPQEQLATDFAYAWIKEHRQIVERFWKAIKSDLENMGYFEE